MAKIEAAVLGTLGTGVKAIVAGVDQVDSVAVAAAMSQPSKLLKPEFSESSFSISSKSARCEISPVARFAVASSQFTCCEPHAAARSA